MIKHCKLFDFLRPCYLRWIGLWFWYVCTCAAFNSRSACLHSNLPPTEQYTCNDHWCNPLIWSNGYTHCNWAITVWRYCVLLCLTPQAYNDNMFRCLLLTSNIGRSHYLWVCVPYIWLCNIGWPNMHSRTGHNGLHKVIWISFLTTRSDSVCP